LATCGNLDFVFWVGTFLPGSGIGRVGAGGHISQDRQLFDFGLVHASLGSLLSVGRQALEILQFS
jgi:hypothetical protein